MDLKRSTISSTTMIAGAWYTPLFSGGKEKLSGYSVVCWCSILLQRFLTVGIHPATLGISSLPASSLSRENSRESHTRKEIFALYNWRACSQARVLEFLCRMRRSSTVGMLSSWSATLSAKGLSSGTVQGITFPRTVRKFSSASYSHVIMFCICFCKL